MTAEQEPSSEFSEWIEEQETAQQPAAPPPPAAKGNGGTLEDRKREARELITVTPGRGLSPDNYAAYVTVAQGMCRPDNIILKQELRNNVAVVIGLLDIAARARLSPYLLAMKAYVQKGTLCFESQAFHALARPFLDGGLKGEYIGEGDEMRLIVRGRLKGDPFEYEHKSPKLKDVHPGHTYKEVNGERIKYCKGSPLWDRKPAVQLWYDTTRDWVRLHCPEAVLGVYTQDEVESDEWRDVTPRPTLNERLAVSERPAPEVREGFKPEETVETIRQAEAPEPEPAPAEPARRQPVRQKRQGKAQKPAERKTRQRAPEPREKAPATRKQLEQARAVEAKPKPAVKPAPKETSPEEKAKLRMLAAAYIAKAEEWIAASTDPEVADQRWEDEFDLRNDIQMTLQERQRLRLMLEEKVRSLRGEG